MVNLEFKHAATEDTLPIVGAMLAVLLSASQLGYSAGL